jgi:hypothetical protein
MIEGIFINEKELQDIIFRLEHIDIELGSLYNLYGEKTPEQIRQINIYNDTLIMMFYGKQ